MLNLDEQCIELTPLTVIFSIIIVDPVWHAASDIFWPYIKKHLVGDMFCEVR